ncbi:VOC family protein [Paenibacillus sp. 1P07SE]|uniref:VOC family protein n=1 Tax=Paenibacillus sp. 1P07SE TaxID=3132209 RepID=UPI0039A4B43F
MTHVHTSQRAVVPHLWFDKEALEAAAFYCATFPESKVTTTATLNDTPSGDNDLVSFSLWGVPFMAISAGPYFKINPSISFIVNFDPSREENAGALLEEAWSRLIEDGTILMPLGEYPFSQQYGWVQDKYGVSWQLMLTDPDGEPRPTIVPNLMFTGENAGKAEEARAFYLSFFRNSRPGTLHPYGPGQDPNPQGTVMFSDFMLESTWLSAMDSALSHDFAFNEAVSLLIRCETQEEIDHYWEHLSAVPEAEQCGWLKDRYGISWQVSAASLENYMATGTPEQRARVTEAFMKMKKFNLAELDRAFHGS